MKDIEIVGLLRPLVKPLPDEIRWRNRCWYLVERSEDVAIFECRRPREEYYLVIDIFVIPNPSKNSRYEFTETFLAVEKYRNIKLAQFKLRYLVDGGATMYLIFK